MMMKRTIKVKITRKTMTKMNRTMKIIRRAMKLEKYMIALLKTVNSDSQVAIYEEKLNKNISPGSLHCHYCLTIL